MHQEGLTEILQFANNFQQKMELILSQNRAGCDRIASAGPPLATIDEGDEGEDGEIVEKTENLIAKSPSKILVPVVDSIKVKVVAEMEQVAIELESEKRPITNLKVN